MKSAWSLRDDTIYLNHGSFGPSPDVVRQAQRRWQDRLESQPMDFYVRQLEPAWFAARQQLAKFVDCRDEDLVFAENSTVAMNIVSRSFPLQSSDEVLLTDHEYGAVHRTWSDACRKAGADPPHIAKLPYPVSDEQQIVDAVFAEASPRTKILIVSHITSPTAIVLPVKALCDEARRRGIVVAVDGPHAIAQEDLSIAGLGCDFYTASCHKWLCAPFGSGFLYVAQPWQPHIQPAVWSWGRLPPATPHRWWEEFVWMGTRDPSAFLSIPAAIDFMTDDGLVHFRKTTHDLAAYARRTLLDKWSTTPWTPDSRAFYGCMAHVPLPKTAPHDLQQRLWEQHHIEVPITELDGRRGIRVSCHLYNTRDDIDRLVEALNTM